MGVKDIATPVTLTPSYPPWEDPPLPGGPPATPGGDRTVQSGAGLRTAALVGPGHRIPILYGRCLVTPDIVRVSMSGYRASFLTIISEGPIDAVETWLTDGSRLDEVIVTLGTLATPVWRMEGTIGLAAAYIRTAAGSPYQPKLIGRGRTPYDPRLGAWGAGSYPDPTKCAYSKNPALLMADLKTFPQYGSGRPTVTPDRVDWQSVGDAADWCDEFVGGSKRYEVSLYIQLGQDAKVWEDTIGLHAGLRWREEGGLWHLDYSAPVATPSDPITTDHLVEDSTPRLLTAGGAGLADRPNVFTAEWTDPTDWSIKAVTIRHPAVEAGLEAERPATTYKLHGFQTATMTERALWRIAKDIWSEQTLELELTTERLDLVEGSRVPVILPSIGLSGAEFLVTKTTYDADVVRVTARRYDPDTWSSPGSDSSPSDGESVFDTPLALENVSWDFEPYTVDVISVLGLVSQETKYRIAVEYDHPDGTWVRFVRLRLGTGTPSATTGGIVRAVPARVAVADLALPVADGDPVEMSISAGGSGFAGTVVVEDGYITGIDVTTPGSGYTDNLGSVQSAVNGQLISALHVTEKDAGWVDTFPTIGSWRFPAVGNRSAGEGRGRIVIEDVPAPDLGDAVAYGITVAAESVLGIAGPVAADGYSATYASSPTPPDTSVRLLKEGTGSGFPAIDPIEADAIPKGAGGGLLINSKLTDDGTTPRYDGNALYHEGNPPPGSVGLTVKESDGSPSIADVMEVRIAGATVTDEGGGAVTITVSPGGGGTTPVLQVDSFTATASQTAFVLSDAPLTGGILYVTRDGLVARSSDWSLAGSTVTFGTGLDAGVEVQIAFWRAVPDGTSPAFDSFTATEGQTDFTLAHPATLALVVARGGVVQSTTAWSITGGGTTLTFASGLEAGADVSIAYLY